MTNDLTALFLGINDNSREIITYAHTHTKLYSTSYSRIAYNSQIKETRKMSLSWCMDKCLLYSCNGILFGS